MGLLLHEVYSPLNGAWDEPVGNLPVKPSAGCGSGAQLLDASTSMNLLMSLVYDLVFLCYFYFCVCHLSSQETKASASSKMMLDWLKNKSPKKQEDDLPRWSSQFIQAATPKRTSANVMHQWLKKEEGESPAKRPKI